MRLSEQYHFADFTQGHYAVCVDKAKESYRFIGYDEVKSADNFVLWRHDVDFSMHLAYKLAQIEAARGVKATYFIYPHCEFYNLLEKEVALKVRGIIDLGHDIGLHFDSHYYGIHDAAQLEDALKRECDLLKAFFGVEVKVFSFHNNNDFTMSCEEWTYGGLINTYASFFKSAVDYVSDSHGIWRFRRLYDVLETAERSRLQVLTHPEWWVEKPMAPRQRILRAIEGRAQKNIRQYDELLIAMNRPNIDKV